jgi:hypothetical protein
MTVLSGCATGVPAEPSKLKKREIPAEKRLSPARGTAHKICLPNYGGAKLRRIRCLRDLPEPACQNHARTANAAGDIRQCCGESTPIRLLGSDEVHHAKRQQPIFCRACGEIATTNARIVCADSGTSTEANALPLRREKSAVSLIRTSPIQ